MEAHAIYQQKSGTYVVGPDKGEPIGVRRVFRVASIEGAELIVEKWNADTRDSARIRSDRLKDEPTIQTGKDAQPSAEEPTTTTPCTTPRLELVEPIKESVR